MRKDQIYLFQLSVIFIFSILFTGPGLSQVESYTAKLTGKQIVFTPKKYEILVKFTGDATPSEITDIINQNEFTLKYEKMNRSIKVLTFPDNILYDDARKTLIASGLVSGVMPVYVDEQGCDVFLDHEYFTVQFIKNITENQQKEIIKNWESEIVFDYWTPGYYALSSPSDKTIFEAVRQFMSLQEVLYTEPYFYCFEDRLSDTYLSEQWHLKNTSQETGYIWGNDINAFYAWDITSGSSDVIIVIIDSGIDTTHADLAGNILDRDGDDWNFVTPNPRYDPPEPYPECPHETAFYHGTAVSGISSAVNNSIGVRGVAYDCKLMPLRESNPSEKANAINYAVSRVDDFTAMVINCSWHAPPFDQSITLAIDNAYAANIPVICASGNALTDVDELVFPASYEKTIAVGAIVPCDEERKTTQRFFFESSFWYGG